MAVLGASFLLLPALAVLTGEGAVMVVLAFGVPAGKPAVQLFAGKAGGFAWWFFLATGVLFTATVPPYITNGTANYPWRRIRADGAGGKRLRRIHRQR